MKAWARDILFSVLVGFVVPGMVLSAAVMICSKESVMISQTQEASEDMMHTVSLPVKIRHGDEMISESDMDSYLLGVVLAEMPAFFEPEALKSQAVVARTYARKAYTTGGKHGDSSVCTEPSCCQGYCSEERYLRNGGTAEAVEKIRNAVFSTSGQVLTYDGELIEATYFSCSGGSTEDAAAVWGTDYPYLRSVDSLGEEAAACFRDEMVFAPEEVEAKLGVSLTGNPEAWVGQASYTKGGSVDTIVIGGKAFPGTQVRERLGLRSAAFSVEMTENSLKFITKGYGHRVGMSQYGADAMAAKGSTYEEILAHYYRGTEIVQLAQ